MKIICIGRNYVAHAEELGNKTPMEPVIFMKPDSAIFRQRDAFYIPDWTNEVHYEVEIVIKINRLGKNIEERFAPKYFSQFTLGIDFTARDIQDQCKAKGHPWEIAKAFDNSAALSEFISLENVNQEEGIKFQMKKNGEVVQDGNTKDLIFDFNFLICYVSKFFKLQMGDMIFTGTPAGVGPVEIGDHLEGFVDGEKLMDCQIR